MNKGFERRLKKLEDKYAARRGSRRVIAIKFLTAEDLSRGLGPGLHEEDLSGSSGAIDGSVVGCVADCERFLRPLPGSVQAEFRVPSSNPPVKDRINCVNAMLRNQAGQRHLFMDPNCKDLIRDLKRVRWKADPNGIGLADIDDADPKRPMSAMQWDT